MTQTYFTVGQIADVLDCKENTARMLLNVAGAMPRLSEYNLNTEETVPKQMIINLASMRANGRIGRKLTRLLATWPTES